MRTTFSTLFTNGEVETLGLREFQAFTVGINLSPPELELPPIQRGGVWKTDQVEYLWDSLLRGFPIGSLLVSSRKPGTFGRSLIANSDEAQLLQQSQKKGYFLLDGQQRSRAICLAFADREDAKLWIDLVGPRGLDSEKNEREHIFRLVSNAHPWGVQRQDPSASLTEGAKWEARKHYFGGLEYHFDYQVKVKDSWPADSIQPVPFKLLVELIRKIGATNIQDIWVEASRYIPSFCHTQSQTPDLNYLPELAELLDRFLHPENGRRIVLLLKPESRLIQREKHLTEGLLDEDNRLRTDELETLFIRVNRNGTTLQGEEMNFSLLKSKWPQAFNMVEEIIKDAQIGTLLPPTGIVMVGARLARLAQNISHTGDLEPSVATFRRWVASGAGKPNSFLAEMISLLEKSDDGEKQNPSGLRYLLKRFCELALYRSNEPDDPGLPADLLLEVRPVLWHPVLAWLRMADTNSWTPEQHLSNRYGILRYLAYCRLAIHEKHKEAASRFLVFLVWYQKRYPTGLFPDKIFYKQLVRINASWHMPRKLLAETKSSLPHGSLKSRHELFGPDESSEMLFHHVRHHFWHNRSWLIWFQRRNFKNWFPSYDLKNAIVTTVPYDYDHILASSHLGIQGGGLDFASEERPISFADNRFLYRDSIGNFRLWPKWANRSDQNSCHTKKLALSLDPEVGVRDFENFHGKQLGFTSPSELQIASLVGLEDRQAWLLAGQLPQKGIRYWPIGRREAWRQAVELRASHLYNELFHILGYESWISPPKLKRTEIS